MRIHQLSLQGISEAFREQVSVDFEALGPGLIASVGENGAGKSTLIGSVFAALFRQLPGQKRSLYDFCTHAKPEIDMTFGVNGGRYRSLLKLDPKARQMESYIFDSHGVALASGKKEAFAEWVGKHVGSPTAFLASIFSSQRRKGELPVLRAKPAQGTVYHPTAWPGTVAAHLWHSTGIRRRERQESFGPRR
jgi:DNA repair exonuclease SbcCD ATPase subunit